MPELEPKNSDAWSRSLKFEFRVHSPGLWGKGIVKQDNCLKFGYQIILEPEPKTFRCWSRSL